MKTYTLRTAMALLAAGVLVPAVASAQSLGELAKQEEARRKTITTPPKVYTNDTIRASDPRPPMTAGSTAPGSPAAGPAAGPAAPPSASGTAPAPAAGAQPPAAQTPAQTPSAPPAADPKQEEANWRKRVQTERDNRDRAQTFADALQSRINALSNDFAARDDPAQRAQISTDRQKALAELERVKQEIAQHAKTIAGIQEEARKAGIPPGWVR
jgi:hypothetical protein